MSFYDEATEKDLHVLEEQLGRLPRGVIGIGARCVCQRPLVVVTAPRLENGEPFPTTGELKGAFPKNQDQTHSEKCAGKCRSAEN